MVVSDSARLHKGIVSISENIKPVLLKEFAEYSGSYTKFVPASGAASRMFKHLLNLDNVKSKSTRNFIENISKAPFLEMLEAKCKEIYQKSLMELLADEKIKDILELLLSEKGLNYSQFPKGLIPFHKYENKVKTAFQEHLSEAHYLFKNKLASEVHFTVTPNFKEKIKSHLENDIRALKGIKVSYSVQKPESNTVSLTENGKTLKNDLGELILRPGGHGALIYNLNEINSDIIFIKNIDNVVSEKRLEDHLRWKQILAGYLIRVQKELFDFQKSYGTVDFMVEKAIEFLEREFNQKCTKDDLKCKLFRPIRVCGMVKNEGEPGGGPYFVKNANGISLQIVESAEIDKSSESQLNIMNSSSHFNPVDIVCGVKRFDGEKYNLLEFVDENSYFVTDKSINNKSIKVLEMPGLWNGGMSDWNTVFVEVPKSTFSPVKSVNDLLVR